MVEENNIANSEELLDSQTTSNRRIAKNTLLLYVRMFIVLIVNLFTQRVVLDSLGVVDYGIYNVVGGFVAMFSIVSSTLSVSISRYITFELGQGNLEKMKRIFSTSINIQIIVILIIVLVGETVGVWFVNYKMTIPADRIIAANWVYQFSLAAFIIGLINVPYNASIVAHERMGIFAVVGVIECLGKLLIAYAVFISPIDKLTYYSLLILLLYISIRVFYLIYCKKSFEECVYKRVFDRKLLKNMFGFAGWNMIGASAGVLRDQGVNIVLNIFCGPVVNAARGIANQVSIGVNSFTTNFMTAVNPQITKSYAAKETSNSIKLVFMSSKFSFYLLLFMSVPVLFETNMILSLWLKIVPEHTIEFVQLTIISILILSISFPLITLMLATGNIRNYQIAVGGCQLLNLPISYLLLRNGLPVVSVYYVFIVIELICLGIRLFMLKKMVGFPVKSFLYEVVTKTILVALICMIIPALMIYIFQQGIARLSINVLLSLIIVPTVAYLVGCSPSERAKIQFAFNSIKTKFSK